MNSENRLATLVLRIRKSDHQFHIILIERSTGQDMVITETVTGECDRALNWANQIHTAINPSLDSHASSANKTSLKSSGQNLFRECFSGQSRELIQSSSFEFLLLDLDPFLTEIPWELCHDELDFFCCRFSVGRQVPDWFDAEVTRHTRSAQSDSILVVSNPTGDLPASSDEGQDLTDFLVQEQRAGVTWLNHHVDCRSLREGLLETDLLHYSGHFDHGDSMESSPGWKLSDGILTGHDIRRLSEESSTFPLLVFNNSCDSAGTRDGEVDPFFSCLIQSGCLHYIGGLSKVVDHLGREFSRTFYQHVLGRVPVGSALRLARLHMRHANENDDSTWAQYVLYGDPTKGIYGERANFPESKTLVFIDTENERIDSTASEYPESERVNLPTGQACLLFSLPSDAVRFSLSFMRESRLVLSSPKSGFLPKVAIGSGELSVERMADSGGAVGVEGYPCKVGLSLLETAEAGQVLTTRPVLDDARASVSRTQIYEALEISWLDHGVYKHQDLEDPIPICEVGEFDVAPLRPPSDTKKIFRTVSPDQEPVLGWRPALDLEIPTSPGWILNEKLGQGGFGEVWRAKHKVHKQTRVFKFCFKADRVRSLKREVTLFRILKERLGLHPNIVQIHDVYFDSPPFYISMEDVHAIDLGKWCQIYCKDERVDESVRLELVAMVADALQVAHDAGLIHRDIKPSNVLVQGTPDAIDRIRIKLTDFGIGQVQSTQLLADVTALGFSETFSSTEMSSGSGSRLYMAPELLIGKQSSIRSDIYSLGVMLYQLILGDCDHPLTVDWERDINDPILLGDLRGCLAGEPGNRHRSAGEVAERLRTVPERRQEHHQREESIATEFRRKRKFRLVSTIAGVAILLVVALGFGLWRAETEREIAVRMLYYSQIKKAERILEDDPIEARRILFDCPERFRGWEWGRLVYLTNMDHRAFGLKDTKIVQFEIDGNGRFLVTGDAYGNVQIWDFPMGEILTRLKMGNHPIKCFSINHDSTRLAVSNGTDLRLWNLETFQSITSFEVHEDFVGIHSFSPVESTLAATNEKGDIFLYDLEGTESRRIDTGHTHSLGNFRFTPDGQMIVTAGIDRTSKLIDLSSDSVIGEIVHPEFNFNDVVISSQKDRIYLAAGNDRIYEGSLNPFQFTGIDHQPTGAPISMDIHSDGEFIGVMTNNRRIETYSPTLNHWQRNIGGGQPTFKSFQFTTDGNYYLTLEMDGLIRQRPVSPDDSMEISLADVHQDFVPCMDFHPDSTILATGSNDNTIMLWDTITGKPLKKIPFDNDVQAVRFSPSGDLLAAGLRGGDLILWDIAAERIQREIPANQEFVHAIAFHPDVNQLVAAGSGGAIVQVDTLKNQVIETIDSGHSQVDTIEFSPDGDSFLTGGSTAIYEWETRTGDRIRSYEGLRTPVRAVKFLPDGRRFVSGGDEKQIILWDHATGKKIGHATSDVDHPYEMALSPDGRRLFTRTEILDLQNLQPITEALYGHKAISPDGRILVIGGAWQTLRMVPAFPYTEEGFSPEVHLSLGEELEDFKRDYWADRLFTAEGSFVPVHEAVQLERGITGQWNFAEKNSNAEKGRAIQFLSEYGANLKAKYNFLTTREAGIPDLEGKEPTVMRFPSCGAGAGYRLFSNAKYNMGERTNEYTLLLDLYYSPETEGQQKAIYNTNPKNTDAPELVISATGGLGVDGIFHGQVESGKWHRIACAVSLAAKPMMYKFIDGELVGSQVLPDRTDGRWSIADGTRNEWILLFTERTGNTAPGYVNSIQFRNYAMTPDEVAELGGPSADGIPMIYRAP